MSENVDEIKLGDKELTLVGTAHTSRESVDLVKEVIDKVKPDTVCVELCDTRFKSLKDPDAWKRTNIVEVIKSGRSHLLLAQLILGSYQKKLGKNLKIKPGAEMLAAVEKAEELNSKIALIDRDIKTTLKRTWGSIGFVSFMKLLWAGLKSSFDKTEITAEDIEKLKSSDVLAEALSEFSRYLPEIQTTLIDERDRYMAQKIAEQDGKNIVAVVGAGHVPGIKKYLSEPQNLEELMTTPSSSMLGRVFGYGIPALFFALLFIGVYQSGIKAGASMLQSWALITGGFGALGAIITFCHPLTVVISFLVAPFATLHPLLATGWFTGLAEAWIRKPTVQDFETVLDDLSSVKGAFTNRVSRILVVIAVTNLCASMGTILGITKIASQ
jgi:pheromone shutdown-related protein TraB